MEPTGEPNDSSQAPPTSTVAVFFDLATRDGRRCVEVRSVTPIANGFYASPRATVYSCAYATQSERHLAIRRARRFCDAAGHSIVHFGKARDRRAAWQ